ncbi:hypothetical protein CAPTEDRAFT_177929 [Capitella teleta]|uniref:Uncharacterized protein n=1 Tax=Capitella teleta TaxID=283909 RepID=R7TBI7_CAPTE|nr:hypothetical protein CAPTEDRAFT_177929 [Capitella teleta]|eukprot:ELT91084.1 hypothetical protein CAPTEDRAFT_177929 [Capitella teleta]
MFLRSDSAHSESDVFSASLKASEADRQRDAWIPSEPTRLALVNLLTSAQGSYTVPHDQLTLPGLINDDPQGDPVKDLVQKFISEHEASNRKTLSAADVSHDEDGIQQLMNAECWRAAIDLTGVILTQCGQGMGQVGQPSVHSPCSLRVWMLRISLLIKLQLFSLAESECQAFGSMDTPDLYFEYYFDQFPGKRGSMVPFEFRVICAELPQYLGKSQESLDRLYYLYAIAGKILENLRQGLAEDGSMLQLSDSNRAASTQLWTSREIRLLYAISNCALNIKDYQTAIEVLEDLLVKDVSHKVHLWSGIARTYLQMGDLKSGMHYIDLFSAEIDPEDVKLCCINQINRGFLAIGQNNFPEAQKCFQNALEYEPNNVIAVNNMAVCYLYMGKLKEALYSLEGLVQESPHLHLQEGLLFNLSTLYELQSSRAMNKKQTLLNLVNKHKGNGFNVACLKMT